MSLLLKNVSPLGSPLAHPSNLFDNNFNFVEVKEGAIGWQDGRSALGVGFTNSCYSNSFAARLQGRCLACCLPCGVEDVIVVARVCRSCFVDHVVCLLVAWFVVSSGQAAHWHCAHGWLFFKGFFPIKRMFLGL